MYPENPHLRGAILFANELLNSHTESDAKRIHTSLWRGFTAGGRPIDINDVVDSFRNRLFMDTVDMLLRSLHPKDAFMMRARFGFSGEVESSYDIADELGMMPITVINRLKKAKKKLVEDGAKVFIREFRADQSTEDLAEILDTLPPILPYRKTERYAINGRLTYLKP